jgi:type III secretion protein J
VLRSLATTVLGLMLGLLLAGCQTQLFGNLSESEANAVLAALLDASLSAEKRLGEENTFAVFVEADEFAQAVRVVEDQALPGRRYDDMGNVFGKEAMFSTPLEEKARYLYAMQEELAHTVGTIDGVLQARVHLVLQEKDQLGRDVQTPSAAVFVKYLDDERHDATTQRREIRRLVAAAIANLDEERIVVSFFPSPIRRLPPVALSWRSILGVRVEEDSLTRLGVFLGCLLLLVLVLLGLLVRSHSRKNRP